MANLFYLPLRITGILGWIGISTITQWLIPELSDSYDALRFSVARKLMDRYSQSLVLVSDEQAPSLYLYLTACVLRGRHEMAEYALSRYFASFAEKKGNLTRSGIDGVQAFRYILSLGPEEYRPADWRPANPSHVLPVLLLFGRKLNLDSSWDLKVLDRTNSAFFIPDDYRAFGQKVIDSGKNYTQQLGFGIWSLMDFAHEFERALKESFSADTLNFPKEGVLLCAMASLLFPDRLPLLLEPLVQSEAVTSLTTQ